MRSRGRVAHACFRHFLREELNGGHAEDFRQTLDRACPHIFLAPLDTLIPFDVRPEQSGDLLLRQAVPLAQGTNPSGNEFE